MNSKFFAKKYQVDEALVVAAVENMESKKTILLAISGGIGAGKDTVAPLLVEELGYKDYFHESFARALRQEVDQVIAIIKTAESLEQAIEQVRVELNALRPETVVKALYPVVKDGSVTTAYQRTPETRYACQFWGTEERRAVDENYWVNQAMANNIRTLAEGRSVILTDCRFSNEVEVIEEFNGVVLRLDVSSEVQRERIMLRDGAAPSDEALAHDSEHMLDDYPFTHRVNTDMGDANAVVAEGSGLLSNWLHV